MLTNNFPEFTGRVCPAPCEVSTKQNMLIKSVLLIMFKDCHFTERHDALSCLRSLYGFTFSWPIKIELDGPGGVSLTVRPFLRGEGGGGRGEVGSSFLRSIFPRPL